MSDLVSAKPELLSTFASTVSRKAQALDGERVDRSGNFFTFLQNDYTGTCGQGCVDLLNTHAVNLAAELGEIALFVQIVHDALLQADAMDADGVVRFNGDLAPYLEAQAARYGLRFSDVAESDIITKDDIGPLDVSTVPENSGFVNDPVCTATGHLLIDAYGFAMPPRLDVLGFRRTYASRDVAAGAFGPGWWSWTECRSEVLPDGSFVYRGPDALEFALEPFGDGTFVGRPELDVQVTDVGDERFELRWGRRSRYPYQRWTFASGRLVEVTCPFLGTNTFQYGSSGLSRIVHDSGRSITLRWSRRRVVAIESSDGRVARFSYDRHGRLVEVDNAISPERYEVDDRGQILSITDADGVRTVAMTYDDDGRVVEQVTAAGFMTRFRYDTPHRTTLEDGDHNPLSVYTHDDRGRVELYATGGGLRFTRRFDDLGRIVEQRDPDGTSFSLHQSFDGPYRVEELHWSNSAVDRYTYDHADRLVAQASPGRDLVLEYGDGTVFPTRVAFRGDEGLALRIDWQHGVPALLEDGDGVVTSFEVRGDGTIAAITNGYGAVTRLSAHPSGAVSRIEYADGRVVHNERDDAGRLLVAVDAAGGRSELRYTAAGRLVSATDQAGSVTTIEYDDTGTPVRVVAADGVATEFLFDDQQRPRGVKFANGDAIGLELDEFGRQVAVSIDDKQWVTERDPDGRITKSVDPTGGAAYQTYGEQVQWSEITDAAGATSRIEMDLARRVTSLRTEAGEFAAAYAATGLVRSHTTESGTTREFSYTPGGRVAKVVEGDSATDCRYDEAGQLVAVDYGSGWWTFDRDAYGHITRRVSPAGREQRFGYDVLGNVRTVEVGGATWRFDYDPLGRVTATTDPTGRTKTFAYDEMGRMVESRDGRAVALRYEYDLRGRISSLIDGAGGVVEFGHNPLGELTSVVDQLGRRTVVSYDAAGQHIGTEYFDRDGTAMSPDPFARPPADDPALDLGDVVTCPRTDSPDGMATWWTLPDGERVELRRDPDGLAAELRSPGFVRTFERDGCGRVVAVTDDSAGLRTTTRLRRDAAGRVVAQDVDGTETTYAYDDAGQLVRLAGPAGVTEWEYDDAGRLAVERGTHGDRRFEYDAAHQLVSLTDGDDATSFEYDARGRRVRATGRHDVVYVWGNERLEAVVTDGRWTRLSFDDAGQLSRFGDHDVRWRAGGVVPEPAAVDGNAVISIGASTFGTVDGGGQVEWRPFSLADAWGDSDRGTVWHGYSGLAVDGIVWLGVRPYDVATRQFLSPDPLAPVPGGAGGSSPYTYAFNDPVNFVDPTGRQGQPISREDFDAIADRYTGVQWGNVARVGGAILTIAACIVVTVVTAGAASPLLLAGISAAGALLTGVTAEGLDAATNTGDGEWNTGPIVRDTLLAFAGGYAGGLAARAAGPLATRLATTTGLPQRVASGATTFATEGLTGAAEATAGEVYDVTMPEGMRPYLGGDGSFDGGQIAFNTAANAVLGPAIDEALPRIPGVRGMIDAPTNGIVDPSNINPTVSPAPDLPDPIPAGAGDVTPASDGDVTPAETGDVAPSSNGDSAPVAAGNDAPAVTGDPAPATAGDPAPAAGNDAPAATGDPAPSIGGDPAPTTGSDPAPSAATDPAPSAAADPAPATNGDTAPSAASDPAPSATGDPAPSAAADPAPATAGDPAPSAGGDPVPAADGDAVASANGDGAPATARDGSPAADEGTSAAAGESPHADAADATPAHGEGDGSPQGLQRVERHFGDNRFEYTTDGATTRAAKFELAESHSGLDRSAAEVDAQSAAAGRGLDTDHGGHIVGHRFTGDQGDVNLFPQDARFNNSAYRRMENEWAGWTSRGYEVEGMVSLDPPGAVRPDHVDANYVVTDPRTGDIVDYTSVRFRNEAGQTFDRVPGPEMGQTTTGLTVRGDGDVPAVVAPGPDSDPTPAATGDPTPAAAAAAAAHAAPAGAAHTAANAGGTAVPGRDGMLAGNRYPGDHPPADVDGNPLNADGTPVEEAVVLVRIDGEIHAVGGAQGGDDWVRGTNETKQNTSRSSFRDQVVRDTYDAARVTPEGLAVCSNGDCDTVLRVEPFTPNPDFDPSIPASKENPRLVKRDWDMGHIRSWHNRWFHPATPRAAVVESYNRALAAECIPCNRSAQDRHDDRFGIAGGADEAAAGERPVTVPDHGEWRTFGDDDAPE
jgi:RHS repeat-associated protein